jgi:hypothetical protein
MKRISVGFIIAAISFVIGSVAAAIWFVYRNPTPPVSVCALIQNPDDFTSKSIRVRGIIFGHDEMGLYASNCEDGASYIHALFDKDTWGKFIAKTKPSGTYHFMGNQSEYLVNATVTGRFERYIGGDGCDEKGRQLGGFKFPYTIYCYSFTISDIEETEAMPIDSFSPNAK